MLSFHEPVQIRLLAGAPESSPILWAYSLGFDHSRHVRMSTSKDKKSNRFDEGLGDIELMKTQQMKASHNQN